MQAKAHMGAQRVPDGELGSGDGRPFSASSDAPDAAEHHACDQAPGEQAALTPLHALQELGIPSEKEDSSLLRKYFERRVPLADQSDFGRVGSSSGGRQCSDWFPWTSAFFVEQTALDGGRLERSWLLTGFTEPNAQFHFSIKKTPGLKPFSS